MTINLIDDLQESSKRGSDLLQDLLSVNDTVMRPFKRTWSTRQIADLLQTDRAKIKHCIRDLGIERSPITNHTTYSLESINRIRSELKLSPRKSAHLPTVVIAVMSGKGGVAKTTYASHLCQWLSIQGLRVLAMDMDSQATKTSQLTGQIPHACYDYDETVHDHMTDKEGADLRDVIVQTPQPGLSIIPCCTHAAIMDLGGIQKIEGGGEKENVANFWRLKSALQSFQSDYDVIVLDTPPTFSYPNMRSLLSADILIHPIVADINDYASSVGYEDTILQTMQWFNRTQAKEAFTLHSRKYVITKFDGTESQQDMVETIRDAYNCYDNTFDHLREIINANSDLEPILTRATAVRSSGTRKKALKCFDDCFGEVYNDINKFWGRADPVKAAVTNAASQYSIDNNLQVA